MKPFWPEWPIVKDRLSTKALMLFFDFDGTLAPIAPTPEEAHIPQETLDLLNALSEKKSCKIAVVSGRALYDIKKKIGLENIVYAGNHGFEIEGPDIRRLIPVSESYLETLRTIKSELSARIEGYKGAFIEDKGITLSVHFRRVEVEGVIELGNKIREVLQPYRSKELIRVRSGKMVFEIRPAVPWDKGEAAGWIIERWREILAGEPAVPLYCGDDATDEDAFRVLADKGITILIGAHEDSAAQYYLDTQGEVSSLLRAVFELTKQL